MPPSLHFCFINLKRTVFKCFLIQHVSSRECLMLWCQCFLNWPFRAIKSSHFTMIPPTCCRWENYARQWESYPQSHKAYLSAVVMLMTCWYDSGYNGAKISSSLFIVTAARTGFACDASLVGVGWDTCYQTCWAAGPAEESHTHLYILSTQYTMLERTDKCLHCWVMCLLLLF